MSEILSKIEISAIAQIAILYAVIYSILKAARGSRFGQALTGVGLIAAVMFLFTYVFHFDVLSTIVRALLAYLAISTVVIFQPEIRRILSQLGAFGTFERQKHSSDGAVDPKYVVDVILELAAKNTGALIAIERGISLRGYEATGVATDALFSRELMEIIFTPPMPLHDGGVTIRNGRIAAAHCVFPVSNSPSLISSGMRHRAAVGLSEETDALVIAVSEESGSVSIAHNGRITRYAGEADRTALQRWISKAISNDKRDNPLVKLYKKLQKGASSK